MWRRLVIALSLLIAAGIGTSFVLDRLLPPNLERFADQSVTVLDRQGAVLRAFTSRDGMWRLRTTPEDVEPRYLAMLKAYEDRRFERHVGVDPLALGRALWQMASRGRIVSGGSTLTMQAARLLEPHPHDLLGKLADIARALQLEWHYGKREILTYYLTLAPFGGNLEGVRAASLAYFGKEPAQLTDGQAALLVALPQSPTRRRPELNPLAARNARDQVLNRLERAGLVSLVAAAAARDESLPRQRLGFPFQAPHLADRLAAGAAGGSRIATTIDGRLQTAIERLAQREAAAYADGARLAILVVENQSRAVRAYLGNTDFNAPQGQLDLAQASRSPGSTLKPFIYGIAFDDLLLHPETMIDDRPMRFGSYAPQNFDRGFHGTVSVRYALQHSLNVPAVAVLDRVGPERFAAALRQAGAQLSFPRIGETAALPLALGGVGIDLADLTMLYAAIAAGGEVKPLIFSGDAPPTPGIRLISRTAAAYLTGILVDAPLPDGISPRAGRRDRGWIAFKTGTSYGFRDAWAIGYSATHTIGVWVGRAEGTPRPEAYGRNTAAPVLFKLFDLMPANGLAPLPAPDGDAIQAASAAQLPANLRRFAAVPAAGTDAPSIVYPPDGAIIDLADRPARHAGQLALIADGGEPPLQWIVNGRPLPSQPQTGQQFWPIDGDGFARITLVDRRGRTASAEVRLRSDWR